MNTYHHLFCIVITYMFVCIDNMCMYVGLGEKKHSIIDFKVIIPALVFQNYPVIPWVLEMFGPPNTETLGKVHTFHDQEVFRHLKPDLIELFGVARRETWYFNPQYPSIKTDASLGHG